MVSQEHKNTSALSCPVTNMLCLSHRDWLKLFDRKISSCSIFSWKQHNFYSFSIYSWSMVPSVYSAIAQAPAVWCNSSIQGSIHTLSWSYSKQMPKESMNHFRWETHHIQSPGSMEATAYGVSTETKARSWGSSDLRCSSHPSPCKDSAAWAGELLPTMDSATCRGCMWTKSMLSGPHCHTQPQSRTARARKMGRTETVLPHGVIHPFLVPLWASGTGNTHLFYCQVSHRCVRIFLMKSGACMLFVGKWGSSFFLGELISVTLRETLVICRASGYLRTPPAILYSALPPRVGTTR